MKPIKLKIKNINSFLDEQVVDFEELMAYGMFGIFGNTGSGKTSVLDGISLAFYGVLARGSTEFVNLGCDMGTINFKFSLNDRIYLIERDFEVDGNGQSKNNNAILVDITDLPDVEKVGAKDEIVKDKTVKVLGSTPAKVNKGCFELLKLKKDDFFKTIVLPQGQFSDFLKLTGTERRELLERIFSLQEYGELLEKKIKKREQAIKDNIKVIQGVTSNFSDLSQEYCDQLKQEIIDLYNELKILETQKQTVTKKYDDTKNMYDMQQKKALYLEQLNSLKVKLEEFEKAKKRNDLALVANQLKDFLGNKQTLSNEYSKVSEKLTTLKTELGKLEELKPSMEEKFQVAKNFKESQVSVLTSEKTKLELALVDDKALKELYAEIDKLVSTIKKLTDEKSDLTDKKTTEINNQTELNNQVTDLQNQITDNVVTAKERSDVNKGITLLNELAQLQKEEKSKSKNIEAVEKTITDLTDQLTQLNTRNSEFEKLANTSNITEEENQTLSKLEKELEDAKKSAHKHEIDNIVSTLKSECEVGKPCPVCGVKLLDMPEFANDDKTDFVSLIANIESKIEKLKHELDGKKSTQHDIEIDIAKIQSQIDTTKYSLETAQSSLKELQEEFKIFQDTIAMKKQELEELKTATEIVDFKEKFKAIENKDIKTDELSPRILQIKDLHKEVTLKVNNLIEEISKIETQIGNNNVDKDNKTKQAGDIEEKLKNSFGEDYNISEKLEKTVIEIETLEINFVKEEDAKKDFDQKLADKNTEFLSTESQLNTLEKSKKNAEDVFLAKLSASPFTTEDEISKNVMEQGLLEIEIKKVTDYFEELSQKEGAYNSACEGVNSTEITKEELVLLLDEKNKNQSLIDEKNKEQGKKLNSYATAVNNFNKCQKALSKLSEFEYQLSLIDKIKGAVAQKFFVQYVASSRLKAVCHTASQKLAEITNNDYELRIDDDYQFLIKDNINNGALRSPRSLSGGETFMVSLTLALAISKELQLKSATALELFFLDEGFDTLDDETLETVVGVVEKLSSGNHESGDNIKIGIITHLSNLKSRIPIKLMIESADSLKGSTIRIEKNIL